MEYVYQVLSGLTENSEHVRLLFIASIMFTVFIVGIGLAFLISGIIDPVRRRLLEIAGPQKPETSSFSADTVAQALKPLSHYILPQKDWERGKVSAKLVHAGFRSSNALIIFYGIKSLSVMLSIISTISIGFVLPGFSTQQIIVSALVVGFIALITPDLILNRLINKRQRLLRAGFPDALDLLVVCTEAGLGLNAALQRVAEELNASHPQLAGELALVNAEIQAGVDRSMALKNLSNRTNLTDLRGLVAALSQSMRFGTSIADTLRIYSEELRDKRMQQAEEEAAKMGTKMIFPLVFCLWPGFFVIAVGPAILGVLRVLKDSGMGK